MKKIVFILFITFLISQICFGNPNIAEQQDKLGVSIIGSRIQGGKSTAITWTGSSDSYWNNADNWNPTGVPDSGSDVIIPSGVPNIPSLNIDGWCNDLEVNSGGHLNIPDYTLYVFNDLVNNGYVYQTGGTLCLFGTITNTGTYDADDGTFLYGNSTLTQTIASPINYHNLEVTGANKVLDGNTSVYGYTNLNGAGIDVGNYDFTSYSHQISQTTSNQDYIITSGTGSLKYGSVSTPSVSSGLFPIGPDASNYNHFYFNNLGVLLDWLSARVQPGITPPHSNSSYCLQRTWDINYGPLGSLSANFEFGWNGSQETPLFTTARENDRIQAHVNHTGSIWETIGSPGSACGPGPGGGYTFQDGPFALVSNFALGDGDHTLPVELSSFNAVYSNDFVSIQWATASETDVIGFNLYRSCEDNIETSEKVNVSLIPGHGTTNQPNEYSFIDETADAYFTTYYYWLEAVNFGGTSNIYGSIQYDPIDVDGDGQLNTVVHSILNNSFPNPVTIGENITFNFMIGGLEGTMHTVSLNIYNVKGELVKEIINEDMMVNNYTETWKVDDIANGVYFYQLRTENYTETKKLLIQ